MVHGVFKRWWSTAAARDGMDRTVAVAGGSNVKTRTKRGGQLLEVRHARPAVGAADSSSEQNHAPTPLGPASSGSSSASSRPSVVGMRTSSASATGLAAGG